MDYTMLAAKTELEKTAAALAANGFMPEVLETKEDALERIKELIPKGASVMNGASKTLEQIGYIEYLKAGKHGWNNLHANILAETDSAKQADLRKMGVLSDYYLGSVHALSTDGQMVISSNSG